MCRDLELEMHSVQNRKLRSVSAMQKNNRRTRGNELKVLAYKIIQYTKVFKRIGDINRTVSRRSELKSRTFLMDEQSNPWERLHPQDKAIQHRGGKLRHR